MSQIVKFTQITNKETVKYQKLKQYKKNTVDEKLPKLQTKKCYLDLNIQIVCIVRIIRENTGLDLRVPVAVVLRGEAE